ncbi:MAG: protein-L-isoaspartate(D-aspartate) O-methyltransferase [Elusimicrobia bacterium]|nr:protein-L-isoaspartate(D-aspartate) O-methyltransferase [Elusimicrobiota bacterium]
MSDAYERLRAEMVRTQIAARGVADASVLAAMRDVPRHLFVDASLAARAYEDHPVDIGLGQTVSQPYMVAFMAQELDPSGRRVLEIGTGSGYATAVLAGLAEEVWTIEVEPDLSERARRLLQRLGYTNIRFKVGDGLAGWPEGSPFDRIVLTAAVPEIPAALLEQLKPGGWFLGPVCRETEQRLLRVRRAEEGFETSDLMPVVFVPAHRR